ncbi:MAG: hypothetical protein L6R42_002061 [Xanthoria sp. 1 TBL-2021]|nr:MAG: hypothetical protein L6R42_002061 [Xanthoria sp. 1 TBL-2021]
MPATSYNRGPSSLPRKQTIPTELHILRPDPTLDTPIDSQSNHPNTNDLLSDYAAEPPNLDPKSSEPSTRRSRKRYEGLKRWFSILKLFSQIATTLFTGSMFGIMVYVNLKFYTTRNHIKEGRTPWPKSGTKVWPSIMLLAATCITLCTSTIILFNYCYNFKKLKQSWRLTLFLYTVHIASWIVISVVYRVEKGLHGNNDDLWGWSCSTQAKNIQKLFDGVVDFRSLCAAQSASWYVSIIEFVVRIMITIVLYVINRKQGGEQDLIDGVDGAAVTLLQHTL